MRVRTAQIVYNRCMYPLQRINDEGVKEMSHLDELNDQLLVRRQKMEDIRESGLDPFGCEI